MKRGAPKKATKADGQVHIRVSDADKRAMEKAAECEGLALSAWIRWVCLRESKQK
jgi:uncharacterized protein (DUF1778 family)